MESLSTCKVKVTEPRATVMRAESELSEEDIREFSLKLWTSRCFAYLCLCDFGSLSTASSAAIPYPTSLCPLLHFYLPKLQANIIASIFLLLIT